MFYNSIIDIDSLHAELPFATSPQFREVRTRAFSILTNSMMALVFERLPKEHLEEFATRFAADSSDPALLDFLVEHIGPSIKDDLQRTVPNVMQS